MFKRTQISSCALLALGGALMVPAAPAFAQASPQRIEVTGSRIRSVNAEAAAPIQVITGEEIRASGAINVQDFLLKNPTTGVPGISRTNSNFATSSAGVATVDLRNLGSARTLVLINGRRVVAGVPGSSAVDLNTIPTQFVERIELLTGGASSAYGSDAVAGVVNIILKKQFNGVQGDVRYGESEKGDDKRAEVGVTIGSTGADGKGNIMLYAGASKQGAVLSKDRSFSAVDQISTGALTGDPAELFVPTTPFFSSFAPQGRIFFGPRNATGAYTINRTFDAAGNVIPFSTNGNAATGVAPTGFNRSAFRTIAVPTDRFLFSSVGSYEFAEGHKAFIEGSYALSKTNTVLEPFPLDSQAIVPGGVAAETRLANGAIVANPLIPASLLSQMVDTNGDGLRDYSFTRRLNEVGNRGSRANRDTFRLITGLEGFLFDKTWDYTVFLGYGSTKEAQVGGGQVNVANFRNALSAIPGANGGAPVCSDPIAVAQGCAPISIFGFNSISPAAAGYIQAPSSLSTETTQKLIGATLSGEPFTLAAGPLGVALGFERRDEFSVSEFDALTQAGLNAGNALPRTEGSFNVSEVFGEVRVPLLKDLPGVKSLALNAALRSADYSTVGSTLSYNTGIEWRPTEMFKIRATHAQSTRAPNINELFSPPSQTFPTGLNDPCVGITAASTGALATNCRAAPGVSSNIAANGSFTLNQADVQGVSGFDRGNPLVSEEKGKSTTLGFTFTPRGLGALDNFAMTVDYFDIKIDDAIVATPRQFILDQCYAVGDPTYCAFIKRRATAQGSNSAGSLDEIDSGVTNSGALATKGVDLTVNYQQRIGDGRGSASLTWTHLLDGFLIPLKGSSKDYFEGEVGAAKDKLALRLGYEQGPWGVAMLVTHIGKSALDDQFLAGFNDADDNPLARNSIKVKAKTYADVSGRYHVNKTFELYGGIDNLFDTKPAPVISGLPGNDTGTETNAGTYDPIGRRYYFGVRAKF
jgi:iron complex outermembrane recepter protein